MIHRLQIHPAVAERLESLPPAVSAHIRQRLIELADQPGARVEKFSAAEPVPSMSRVDVDGWSVLYQLREHTVELCAVLHECFEIS